MAMKRRQVSNIRTKIGLSKEQMTGVLIILLAVVVLAAVIATLPQQGQAQTGALITGGEVQQQATNDTKPLTNSTKPITTLRVVYTKS